MTVAAEAGASDREIARQTGHAPGSRALHRYIRHAAPDTELGDGRTDREAHGDHDVGGSASLVAGQLGLDPVVFGEYDWSGVRPP